MEAPLRVSSYPPMRRCSSSPQFSSSSQHRNGQCEIFVAARPFTEFGGDMIKKLSPDLKSMMIDVGLCHFMTIVKTGDGQLVQFDFGPQGGDVHVSAPVSPFRRRDELPKGGQVAGEIRETKLTELPASHMYVGRSTMTLDDIRSFNVGRNVMYVLNQNDCRHYVNTLVNRATGFSCASVQLVRHNFLQRREHSISALERVLQGMQHVTDVDNWHNIQRTMRAAAVAAPMALGMPVFNATLKLVQTVPLAAIPAFIRPLANINGGHLAVAMPIMQRSLSGGALVAAVSGPFAAKGAGQETDSLWKHARSLATRAERTVRRSLDNLMTCASSSEILERLRTPPAHRSLRASALPVAALTITSRNLLSSMQSRSPECAQQPKQVQPVPAASFSFQGSAMARRFPILTAQQRCAQVRDRAGQAGLHWLKV